MESMAVRSERRGRKRRRADNPETDSAEKQSVVPIKKCAVETRSLVLVGRYVKKEFTGSGVYLGKIVYYDTGLYRIDYEDGDCEDLESSEIRGILVDECDFNSEWKKRKKELDKFILNKRKAPESNSQGLQNATEGTEASSASEVSCGLPHESGADQVDGTADSSTDSCEFAQEGSSGMDAETSIVPPPVLPPSSGNIGIPEEYVSHLFSVYTFLRSFSIRLFLCPFGLDEFVGSLNCAVPNTLLNAVHVALMRALRRHLEELSSDGSEVASRCLRCIDWSLLDVLTWPSFIVHYLTAFGYTETLQWRRYYTEILSKEYYALPVGRKLQVLQLLCDDVLESAELRSEIDLREESEVGRHCEEIMTNHLENGPRRVHPRYPKTSACKNQEVMDIISESQNKYGDFNFKHNEVDENIADVEVDGNGDECRLCGMDGTLLCCDGCPSAYHSRCIGIHKLSIPEGSWYCPECTSNKTPPNISRGTLLGAAEIFGIDSFGFIFLGTCDHLLVLNTSVSEASCHRYYNKIDVPKLLQALLSQDRDIYLRICESVIQYWGIPDNVISLQEPVQVDMASANDKEDSSTLLPLNDSLVGYNVADCKIGVTELENVGAFVPRTSTSTVTDSVHHQSSDSRSDQSDLHCQNLRSAVTTSPGLTANSGAGSSDPTREGLVIKLRVRDLGISQKDNSRGEVNGFSTPENMTCQSRGTAGGRAAVSSVDHITYLGSLFKPQAYANQYMHGDFAAAAAANFALLSSEESRVSEPHSMGSSKKTIAADMMLQFKAFSSAAILFFWPHSEKKAAEVPRERCGWCLSCRATVTSKKACLLNSAALNAVKGVMKILPGLSHLKNGEGSLPAIATYMLYMGESLSGLMDGQFSDERVRKKWCKRVEEALTCEALKALLLELEENIHSIGLTSDWLSPVDDWYSESSAVQITTCTAGTTQKRGPGRRSKKQSLVSEVNDDGCDNKLADFSWWRGGNLSKLIYDRGVLPQKMLKKAARQGGSKTILGIYYVDGAEISKRSRQIVWRAAVEMCRCSSQLALQVRYLDLHIRWGDLTRPEHNILDGKGSETEASAFRNANICDKRVVGHKIWYGVFFGNQKHLASRVLKNILEVEKCEDGNDKYWFLESIVPLYLIKEYGERLNKVSLTDDRLPSSVLSKMQKNQLKASRRDIFSYLMRKRDNSDHCSCSSCQNVVLLQSAVVCSVCEGYCHKECTVKLEERKLINTVITCKQCHFGCTFIQKEQPPNSLLHAQQPAGQTPMVVSEVLRQKVLSQTVDHSRPSEKCLDADTISDSALEPKARICSWGLLWNKNRKKKDDEDDDNGFKFRLRNLLMKGNPNMDSRSPICHLCLKPYNPDLMYIRCPNCSHWYHAAAVELEETKIFDLCGFKCCKCRRIRSPVCPYMSPKKQEAKRSKPKKRKRSSGLEFVANISKESRIAAPMLPAKDEFIQDDDSLQSSLSGLEPMVDCSMELNLECSTPALAPQKLPVRRQVKCGERDDYLENGQSFGPQSAIEKSNFATPMEKILSPVSGLDASVNGLGDDLMFDYDIGYDDMEFEPQTYFSFTELLESEDAGQLDEIDPSAVLSGNEISAVSQNGLAPSSRQQQDLFSMGHCEVCSATEPVPDLSCQICKMSIHSYCSPWVEMPSPQEGWSCGRCRDWR